MPKIDHDTKEKILAAAEKVFHANGFKGTRTTQIAEVAGISRTMLHYYFSTKEDLFQEVLKNTMGAVVGLTKQHFREGITLKELIESIIDTLSAVFEEKPGLPSFVVNILNESPEMAHFIAFTQQDTIPKQLDAALEEGKKKGEIADYINGEDLIINIYSLLSIPYLGIEYIKVKEKRDDEAMKMFMRNRKEQVKVFVLKGIGV
jgi:TetR/AcrR family transcriptional regulator